MTEPNWNILVEEYEKHLDALYECADTPFYEEEGAGEVYRFVGLIHGSDDFYYGMVNVKTGRLMMCSCVGSIEGHGFKKIDT